MSTELRSLPVEVATKRVFDAAVRVFEIARAQGTEPEDDARAQ
jgi:hypothetical protein